MVCLFSLDYSVSYLADLCTVRYDKEVGFMSLAFINITGTPTVRYRI